MNPLAQQRWLRQKCRVTNPRTYHRAALKEGREHVLFVDLSLTEYQIDWIHFLEEQINFEGCADSSPEIEGLLEQPPLKDVLPPMPYTLVNYQHPDGLRQVILHHRKFHINRLAPLSEAPSETAIP